MRKLRILASALAIFAFFGVSDSYAWNWWWSISLGQKLLACQTKYGDPFMKNTQYFTKYTFDAQGKITAISNPVGQEAVDLLNTALPWIQIYYSQITVDKYRASIAFAQANPTSKVPNPLYVSSNQVFQPLEWQACANAAYGA